MSRTALSARGDEPVGVSRETHPVSKHRNGEIVDVVGDAVAPSAHESARAGRLAERHGSAGRRAEREDGRRARREDERLEIAEERVLDRHAVHLTLERDETRGIEDDRNVSRGVRVALEKEAHLDLRRRVADAEAEDEAIELRLGQRVGAGEVLRVLSRDDEERVRQRIGDAVDRDLLLVHRLEERGLCSRARSVDLVGQEHVREDRSLTKGEVARALVVDGDADDVAREEIARELDASQLAADRAGEGACKRRLADAGDILDEEVTTCEESDERELDGILFPFEGPLHGLPQLLDQRELFAEQSRSSSHRGQNSTVFRRPSVSSRPIL